MAGQIAVWEVQSGTCMGVVEHPTSHNVSAMAWNPKGKCLLYCLITINQYCQGIITKKSMLCLLTKAIKKVRKYLHPVAVFLLLLL